MGDTLDKSIYMRPIATLLYSTNRKGICWLMRKVVRVQDWIISSPWPDHNKCSQKLIFSVLIFLFNFFREERCWKESKASSLQGQHLPQDYSYLHDPGRWSYTWWWKRWRISLWREVCWREHQDIMHIGPGKTLRLVSFIPLNPWFK